MNNKIIIKFIVVTVLLTAMMLIHSVPQYLDKQLNSLFTIIHGEIQPDTNIVIITIDSDDIEQLGPWPIKRSYYALLINKLTEYDVKKIGLEVFLSSKFVTQVLYDNVLRKEINNSGNVVLSSLAGRIVNADNVFRTDSLSFPSPKLVDESIKTGHINFIDQNGIEIPLSIKNNDISENAFCFELAGISEVSRGIIKINFLSSWSKFRHFSILEFFDLIQLNKDELKLFKDKIVFVGISDPQLSTIIQTDFDEKLPGVALHAFAADNLINNRFIINDYYLELTVLFIILLAAVIFITRKSTKQNKYMLLTLALFLLFSFLLSRGLLLEAGYSFFIIPATSIVLTNFYFSLLDNRQHFKSAVDEAKILKTLLEGKENELSSLQKELNILPGEKKESQLEKIKQLKSDIEKLKENEDDKREVIFKTSGQFNNFQGIAYQSGSMEKIVRLIEKAAPTDAAILITGESGTGKELVAKAVHALSKRSSADFVAVNCAALPDTLLESELFGHTKGSFTGAVADKPGKFEAADNGTIFLDEIGETSESFQAKLLRVLQSGEVDKIGSVKSDKVNVRVISATNKDLTKQVNEKKFREDLFYRINVLNIHLPPLRDRKEDIEPIVNYIIQKENSNINISVAVMDALYNYDWKGNIRELESVIKRALIFAGSEGRNLLRLNDLPEELIKNVKLNFEDLVIQSLREKKFVHSAINDTAEELGKVNRTVVSENFRGYSLKIFVEKNFNQPETCAFIAQSDDEEIISRIKLKLDTWLTNISKDVAKYKPADFSTIKMKLSSKYKNLPRKFHYYLDEVIKYYIK